MRCVLDQNFPAQSALIPWPEPLEVYRLPSVAPELVAQVEDWEIILELQHRGFDAFVSNDGRIVHAAREMVALGLTRLKLIVADGVGDDALKANGLLQLHLGDIGRDTATPPLVYLLRPSGKRSIAPGAQLNIISSHRQMNPADLRRAELHAIRTQIGSTRPHLDGLLPQR